MEVVRTTSGVTSAIVNHVVEESEARQVQATRSPFPGGLRQTLVLAHSSGRVDCVGGASRLGQSTWLCGSTESAAGTFVMEKKEVSLRVTEAAERARARMTVTDEGLLRGLAASGKRQAFRRVATGA